MQTKSVAKRTLLVVQVRFVLRPAKKGKNLEVGYKNQEGGALPMRALGRHIIAELSDCNPQILSNIDVVRELMVQGAKEANAEVREVAFHKFSPQGVSGVVVIAESHLSIHTWPEYNYAAIDIYTCGDTTDPWKACSYLAEQFQARNVATTVVERGIETLNGCFSHTVTSSFKKRGRSKWLMQSNKCLASN